ncbi:MAG: radical SAM protein [Nitrospinae bacterium]|nr:radical SAM protein [Nitrospinota bacterium]
MNYTKLYHWFHKLYALTPYTIFSNGYALPPLQIFFELTYNCNLRCKMCQFLPLISNYDKSEARKEELSLDEVKSIIDQLPRYALITFTGGEPFLRKDFFEILEYVSKRNKYHIVTNGSYLTEENAQKIVSLGCENLLSKGLLMLGVSLEGNQESHDKLVGVQGSFLKTIQGLEYLKHYKKKSHKKFPLLNMAVVISKWNYKDIHKMVRVAEENNIDIISFLAENHMPLENKDHLEIDDLKSYRPKLPEYDVKGIREEIEKIEQLKNETKVEIKFSPPGVPVQNIIDQYGAVFPMQEYGCFSPWSKLVISSNGNVFPCQSYKMGNLRELPLNKIWNGNKAREFRKSIKQEGLFPLCSNCCMLEKT